MSSSDGGSREEAFWERYRWQVRQEDKALRLVYQELIKVEWAAEWAVPLPLEEVAESVPSAELGKKAIFAEWGLWEGSLERNGRALLRLVCDTAAVGEGLSEVKGFTVRGWQREVGGGRVWVVN